MEAINDVSDLRIAAIQNRAAFNVAYNHAPDAVRFKGKVLYKDRANGVEEQLAYLAAVALTEPTALADVANANTFGLDGTSYGVDADKSVLNAAVAQQRKLEAELKKAETRKPQIEREIVRWTGKAADCQIWDGADVGLAILTLGIGTGIKKTVCEQEAKDMLLKLRDELAKNRSTQEDLKDAIVAAATEVKNAQEAYDEELKRLRAEEEAARLLKLEKQVKEAQEKADADAATAAAEAKIAAAEAASARAKQAAEDKARQEAADAEWAAYCKAYPEDCASDTGGGAGFTDDYGNEWQNDYWLDRDAGSDVYGSEDMAADLGASEDFDAGSTYSSPWEFDRYYGCDCANGDGDSAEGYGCDACDAVYGLAGTSYGADYGNLFGGIVAGVLVLAPAIIGAFSDNQSGQGGTKLGERDEQGGSGKKSDGVLGSFTDTVLRETGFQSKIDQHAKTAGAESAAKLTPVIWAVGLGVLGLGVVFLVTRK